MPKPVPQPHLDWVDTPDSSNVARVSYHPVTKTVCVEFQKGGLYTYEGPDEDIFMGLVHADSVGKYLNNVVKAFPYTRWDSEADLIAHLAEAKVSAH